MWQVWIEDVPVDSERCCHPATHRLEQRHRVIMLFEAMSHRGLELQESRLLIVRPTERHVHRDEIAQPEVVQTYFLDAAVRIPIASVSVVANCATVQVEVVLASKRC